MSALPGAAAVILAGGLGEIGTVLGQLALPAALSVAVIVLLWLGIRREQRRGKAAALPHGHGDTQPWPEVGDDAIAMIRQAREEDRAEAEAELEREISELMRKYPHA